MKLPVFLLFCLLKISHSNVSALTPSLRPENITLLQGENHILNCSFQELVNCTWTKDKIPVIFNNRYQYVSNNGSNTTDCSVEIINIQKRDESEWRCSHLGQDQDASTINHSINHVMTEFVFIKVHPKPIILLNGIAIVDHLFINDTETNANLSCVAENSNRTTLYWEVDEMRIQTEDSSFNCSSNINCTITWSGGYDQLVNATNISCTSDYDATTVKVTFIQQNTNESIYRQDGQDSDNDSPLDIESIVLIATGSLALIIVISVSCICLTIYKCKNKSRKLSYGLNSSFNSNGSFHTSVKYYSTNTSIHHDNNREAFRTFKTPPSSIRSSILNVSHEISEKGDICVMPEADCGAGGVIMMHYTTSRKGEREPCDSLYVNRCSVLPPTMKIESKSYSNLQRSPLPKPMNSVRESSGPAYSEIGELPTIKSKEELYDDCSSTCTDDVLWGNNACYDQRLI